MNSTSPALSPSDWLKKSATARLFILGVMMLILLIPAAMISSLIRERQERRASAVEEITSKWGAQQVLSGPVISVPYQAFYPNEKGVMQKRIEFAEFLPDSVTVEATVDTEKRYRGIYEAILYKTQIHWQGSFSALDWSLWGVAPENVLWHEATLSIGIPDMRGVRENPKVAWNGQTLSVNPGISQSAVLNSGIHMRLPLSGPSGKGAYEVTLDLNGSQSLRFYPFGKTTSVHVSSPWPNPSFSGAFLPAERQVSPQGFSASWKVLHINRNYPQQWRSTEKPEIGSSDFGVDFLVPADQYQNTERSTKYAVLFILFTFGVFFFAELLQKRFAHMIQYLLVGLAVVLFYSVLLSLAEHLGFKIAYLLSSLSIIAMISLYAKGVFKSTRVAAYLTGVLGVLYLYLYVLLQIEDYALLMGNIGLLTALGVGMYFSRRTDLFEKQMV